MSVVVVERLCGGDTGCKTGEPLPLHPCPYLEDVNEDHESLCSCCEDCAQCCADGI